MNVVSTFLITACLVCSFTSKASTILVFGDSLSTGYGLEGAPSWVDLLQEELSPQHTVINDSQNGRLLSNSLLPLLEALQEHQPDILVIALGTNDGNQKIKLRDLQRALSDAINDARNAGVQVLVLNTRLPLATNRRYAYEFEDTVMAAALGAEAQHLYWVTESLLTNSVNVQADNLHLSATAQDTLKNRAIGPLTQMVSPKKTSSAEKTSKQ